MVQVVFVFRVHIVSPSVSVIETKPSLMLLVNGVGAFVHTLYIRWREADDENELKTEIYFPFFNTYY